MKFQMYLPENDIFWDCIFVLINSRGLNIVTAAVLPAAPESSGIHIGCSSENLNLSQIIIIRKH